MATLLEHVYSVKNLLNKGVPSIDDRYTESLISHLLNSARSVLLKDKLNKYGAVSAFSYQTICVPLVIDNFHDCDCIPEEYGCKILKSDCQIPRDLISKFGSTIMVRKGSGKAIDATNPTKNDLSQYSEANNPPDIGYMIEDGRIIIFNTLNLQVVLVTAIWDDPLKVKDFCGCSPSNPTLPCYDPIMDEYPIDSDLVRPMELMVVEQILSTHRLPEDNLINAKAVELGQDKEN